ncbi:hypothetical protein ACFSCW_03900 [Sphingomonas tabacisoli]|uniref:Terminase small subunit n=1 Tax=Sphingomonas tabacisoli TaxID=2249466 RepID=A0ABW4I1G4_9SPHN
MPDPSDQQESIPFTPVPLLRKRRRGWTPDRQRQFIDALARCGSVSAAARQVGMSARGAYALLDKEGAESFADAWDMAAMMGMDATRENVIDRAMHGAWVPIVRRGQIVRMEFRYFDNLAIALLSGRGRDSYEVQEERRQRRKLRHFWRDEDRKRDEQRAAEEAAQKAFEEECARQRAEIEAKIAKQRADAVRIVAF